jgi:dihydroorotate dehydrogenase electron transfer subunit
MAIDVDASILGNTRLSDAYNVVALAAPEIAGRVRPGQFVMVKPSRGFEPLLRRPFSVFQVLRNPDGSPRGITLLNKRIGRGTSLLYSLEAGARMACLGPLGRPFTVPDPSHQAWLVAGGVGLAPFATMTDELTSRGIGTTLFYGARRREDLHFADWFASRGVRVIVATEDGSAGTHGLITRPLLHALEAADTDARLSLHVCGPTPMMRAVARLAAQFGREAEVSLEQTMGCGLGGCYSCVVRVKGDGRPPHFVRSCLAGPTFKASQVVWDELQH